MWNICESEIPGPPRDLFHIGFQGFSPKCQGVSQCPDVLLRQLWGRSGYTAKGRFHGMKYFTLPEKNPDLEDESSCFTRGKLTFQIGVPRFWANKNHFFFYVVSSLTLTLHLQGSHPKRNMVFQPSIFRWYLPKECQKQLHVWINVYR